MGRDGSHECSCMCWRWCLKSSFLGFREDGRLEVASGNSTELGGEGMETFVSLCELFNS